MMHESLCEIKHIVYMSALISVDMEDREWMYSGRSSASQITLEWVSKTEEFLEIAFAKDHGVAGTWCPCSRCKNQRNQTKDDMGLHLSKYGFMPGYHRWTLHGERAPRRKKARQRTEEASTTFDTGADRMLDQFANARAPEIPAEDAEGEMDKSTKEFYDTLFASQKTLHAHTRVSQLDSISCLMAVKCQYNVCINAFDAFLHVIASFLPEGHLLPKNMYESKKILGSLKMPYEPIDACPKGCMLFRKEHIAEKYCLKCKSSRYMEVDSGDGQKTQLKVAKKILRYLPFLPRIQRLFMTEESAQQMRWPVDGKRYRPEKMVHPSDGEAWKKFVVKHPKAGLTRSVAVALSTDGFNPYGMSACTYSCWPMFVIPMNLPPGVCMQRQNMFLSLIIPGPEYPGKNMSVYMEPLVDDLYLAWEEGVRTYDAVSKKHFTMYVWYHTSLHDLPARAIFCGWCTHGKWPCPVCMQAMTFVWLTKGGKYSCFDKHRQFLRPGHRFKRDAKKFLKGVVVDAHVPVPEIDGVAIKAQLDALVPNADGTGFVGYGDTHQWTHIPCFWKLPYFQDLLLPHNIDVMHTEKNIAEALWSTLMDLEKSKDNVKARVDQEKLCDRPHMNMQPPGTVRRGWYKPKARFTPTRAQRKEILQWVLDHLFFPDGYAANIMRGVNLAGLRIGGLKSHDYHVWIERIMPVMFRGYIDEQIWLVLAKLSYFFRRLCAKELDVAVVKELEAQTPELLCELEAIFPPGMFNPMQHLLLHLPTEARLGGPVQTRWMFATEREQKVLRKKSTNKCKIEASIAEATLNEEVSNFTTKFYSDALTTVHNPVPRLNIANPEDLPELSIFIGAGGKSSGHKKRKLSYDEWTSITSYVLKNTTEVQPYIE